MVNDAFKKDLSKAMEKTSINTELEPGATPRRYEPTEGSSNLNKRIHKESAQMDKYGNLPFTFSKPKSITGKRKKHKMCSNCGHVVYVSENSIGVICSSCKKYSAVQEILNDGNGNGN